MYVQDLNKSALNQLCKNLLIQEKQEVSSEYLYNLQLTRWGLENLNLEGPRSKVQVELLEQVNVMYSWSPERVNQILDKDDLSNGKDSQEIATYLIENLYSYLRQIRAI
jgi:hypothetical protein